MWKWKLWSTGSMDLLNLLISETQMTHRSPHQPAPHSLKVLVISFLIVHVSSQIWVPVWSLVLTQTCPENRSLTLKQSLLPVPWIELPTGIAWVYYLWKFPNWVLSWVWWKNFRCSLTSWRSGIEVYRLKWVYSMDWPHFMLAREDQLWANDSSLSCWLLSCSVTDQFSWS